MKICLTTVGSEGDIRPFLALAKGLRDAGHDASLAAVACYADRAAALGIPYRPIGALWDDRIMVERFSDVIAEPDPMRQLTRIVEAIKQELTSMVPDLIDATRDVDLVVSHPMNIAGVAAAKVNQKPMIGAHLAVMIPSRTLSPLGTNLGSIGNALLWRIAKWMARRSTDAPLNDVVRAAGLEPWRDILYEASHSTLLNLIAVSPLVQPEDPRWRPRNVLTGYWFLPEPAFEPSAELAAFVEKEPPVVITFGSMAGHDARARTKVLLDGVRDLGRRVVLQAGWANLGEGELPDNVLRVGFVPHDWLFARAACVVHHGGAGTTGAVLRAGVPSVVVWHMGDQPVWGAMVHRLGVGPEPRPHRKLTAPWLRKTLERVIADEPMQRRARDLGERIQREDGVARAVEAIEEAMRRA